MAPTAVRRIAARMPRPAGARRRLGWPAVFACVALAAGGCGGPAVGTVTGTVRYRGEPLPLATICFSCKGGAEVRTGTVKDGAYTVERVPPGPAKIYFGSPAPKFVATAAPAGKAAGGRRMAGDAMRPMPPGMSLKVVPLPDRLRNPKTSGQEYTVRPGPQTRDFDLPP